MAMIAIPGMPAVPLRVCSVADGKAAAWGQERIWHYREVKEFENDPNFLVKASIVHELLADVIFGAARRAGPSADIYIDRLGGLSSCAVRSQRARRHELLVGLEEAS